MAELNLKICPTCNREFSSIYNCNRHIKMVCNKSQDNKYVCNNCEKTFSRQDALNRHKENCSGNPNSLACNKCKKIFKSRQSKCNHEKKCTHVINNNNINTQNNITTQNINTQNNIGTQNNTIIMNFGCEKLDHITDEMKHKWASMIKGLGIFSAINAIHFNPKVPENHNIRLGDNNSRKFFNVFDDQKWITKARFEVSDILIKNSKRLLSHKFIELYDNETDIDKKIIIQKELMMDDQSVYNEICTKILAKVINITKAYIDTNE